jgi:hypothetical protein
MIPKHPLCTTKLRRVPRQFSWVDQRLVRERYIDQLSHQACALYLFLLTVADAQGLSFYADRSLCQRLSLTPNDLHQARVLLIRQGLLAYKRPLYQVLALDADLASANDEAPSPDDLNPVEVKAAFERIWEVLS